MNASDYRTLRRMLGLTQAELAEALGVHVQTIKSRESGKIPVRREPELAIRFLLAPEHNARE